MKVAVCWSGQPRTVQCVQENAKNNLFSQLDDYDLFIHSSQQYPVDPELLNPCVYCVEDQFPFPEIEESLSPHYFLPSILNNYLQQVYGYKRVWELKTDYQKQHGLHYDFVIRARPDIHYLGPIRLNEFDQDKINFLPRAVDQRRDQCPPDIFFAGPDELMGKAMMIFDWLASKDYALPGQWTSRLPEENVRVLGGKHCPETILATYLYDHLRIPTAYVLSNIDDVMRLCRD